MLLQLNVSNARHCILKTAKDIKMDVHGGVCADIKDIHWPDMSSVLFFSKLPAILYTLAPVPMVYL
jgi:hypothetical protein